VAFVFKYQTDVVTAGLKPAEAPPFSNPGEICRLAKGFALDLEFVHFLHGQDGHATWHGLPALAAKGFALDIRRMAGAWPAKAGPKVGPTEPAREREQDFGYGFA